MCEQVLAHIGQRIAGIGLAKDVADALVGRRQAGRLRQGPELRDRIEPRQDAVELIGIDGEDRIDVGDRIAALAQPASQAIGDEFVQCRRRGSDRGDVCEGLEGCGNQRRQRGHRQARGERALDQHPDHAERMAAQGEGVAVAAGLRANPPDAGERLELVGECHRHPEFGGRQGVARKARLVVLGDGLRHGR